MGYGYYDHDMSEGVWWIMVVLMLVLIGLVVTLLVVYLARHSRPHLAPGPHGATLTPSARDILDARFARGEIDADEYKHRRDLLGS